MPFPRIETLDDVLPHVSDERGFVVSRRPDLTVVDYLFQVPDTFSGPVALEARGLKFDRDGRLIARPFHKFFNIGERQQVHEVDWKAPHRVTDKLDGSMIHPARHGGELVFMTRMGPTLQARAAAAHADAGVLDLSRHLVDAGVTPILEFTAPDNRIVVAYDEPRLTLLAAREITSGAYLPQADLEALATRFGVPLVAAVGTIDDAHRFVADARAEEGIEGYVVVFEDGHRLKLKTDAYVARHRALAGLAFEKHVLALVVRNGVDDVVPLLAPELAEKLLAYRDQVGAAIAAHARRIQDFVAENRGLPRKDFAAKAFATFDKRLTGAVFATLDGRDTRAALMELLALATSSDTKVEAIRDLFHMRWSVADLGLPDLEG